MKLLGEFKEQLKSLGELKYAWFTSFNINIEFIETYLLPAALDMDPPKNRMDYEHLQLALNDKKIDFRIFCDARFMDADQNKRTSLPVHGVSPSRLKYFSKESKFHPKVIFLEDKNKRRILGCGSANLSLGGWGRNQEVFTFYEIQTKEQYSAVRQFFNLIAESVSIDERLPRRSSFATEEQKWSFVHSFAQETFVEQLFAESRSRDLVVWSPYFATDLAQFILNLKKEVELDDLRVHLVPDRVQGKFIRTAWSDGLASLVEDDALAFYESPHKPDDNVELCHAKIWKLGGKLAIGSWNFTTPGANLRTESGEWKHNSNIEAGMIIQEPSNWKVAIAKPIEMAAHNFASAELLKEESLEIPAFLPFDIRVSFDWQTQQYSFDGEWIDGEVKQGYAIKVPDVIKPIELIWKSRNKTPNKTLNIKPIVLSTVSELLTERRFLIQRDGKLVRSGLITEINFTFRRSQGFESINDLLDAYVFGGDIGSSDAIPFLPAITRCSDDVDEEMGEDIPEQVTVPSNSISYFRLFQATQQFTDSINAVKSVDELNRRIFTQPGCLLELLEKTKERIQDSGNEMFNWFLANEVKSLCEVAKGKRKKLAKNDSSIPVKRWNALDIDVTALRKNIDVEKDYVELVMDGCGYASD